MKKTTPKTKVLRKKNAPKPPKKKKAVTKKKVVKTSSAKSTPKLKSKKKVSKTLSAKSSPKLKTKKKVAKVLSSKSTPKSKTLKKAIKKSVVKNKKKIIPKKKVSPVEIEIIETTILTAAGFSSAHEPEVEAAAIEVDDAPLDTPVFRAIFISGTDLNPVLKLEIEVGYKDTTASLVDQANPIFGDRDDISLKRPDGGLQVAITPGPIPPLSGPVKVSYIIDGVASEMDSPIKRRISIGSTLLADFKIINI